MVSAKRNGFNGAGCAPNTIRRGRPGRMLSGLRGMKRERKEAERIRDLMDEWDEEERMKELEAASVQQSRSGTIR